MAYTRRIDRILSSIPDNHLMKNELIDLDEWCKTDLFYTAPENKHDREISCIERVCACLEKYDAKGLIEPELKAMLLPIITTPVCNLRFD